MSTLATTNPTLVDLAKRLEPNSGGISKIVEILNETNEVLDDMPWKEGNLPTGHRSTVRTGIPEPTWRKLYGGVQPNRSTTTQVDDNTGMLEAYAEVDKALADLAGNTAAFRLSEDYAFIEGMSQRMAQTLFYGNEGTEPASFTGLAPRFNSRNASVASSDNVLHGGGAGSDNTSIWLVVWGEQSVCGIYPQGSKAGLNHKDLGEVTIENVDGAGGRMQAYRSHYRWDCGLTVKDWRYVVRIANIDTSDLKPDVVDGGADIYDLIAQAFEQVPSLTMGKPVLYCNRKVRSFMRRQAKSSKNVNISMEQVAGKHITLVDEVPVRRCDAILNTEAVVPA